MHISPEPFEPDAAGDMISLYRIAEDRERERADRAEINLELAYHARDQWRDAAQRWEKRCWLAVFALVGWVAFGMWQR